MAEMWAGPAPGEIVVPSNPFTNNTLQCDWANTSQGRCTQEVDYNVVFGTPPCGHAQVLNGTFDSEQVMRFCARHMIRFMFTSLTEQRCGTCGSAYKGLAILKSMERL